MMLCTKLVASLRRSCSIVGLSVGLRSRSDQIHANRILSLDRLTVIPGSRKKRKRVGRGVGSGRGKTSTYGHQFSASTPRQFEGGQTAFWKRMPKSGFKNPNARDLAYLNVGKLQQFIEQGRLVVPGSPEQPAQITMRDLRLAGLVSSVKEGIKLLANDKDTLKTPLHLEVSMASASAIQAVEAAGGTVTCAHFNPLALRALLKPYKFTLLPLRARPNPKIIGYYLDHEKRGYLSPEVQIRNLKLFGAVTSEERMRAEHERYMAARRKELRLARQRTEEVAGDA